MSEISAPNFPSEPPEKSVVLDRNEKAWQRVGTAWVPTGALIPLIGRSEMGQRWRDLLMDFGPVTVLYLPDEEGEHG